MPRACLVFLYCRQRGQLYHRLAQHASPETTSGLSHKLRLPPTNCISFYGNWLFLNIVAGRAFKIPGDSKCNSRRWGTKPEGHLIQPCVRKRGTTKQ